MGQVKTRGRLFGTYTLLYGALACAIVAAWDGDDWRHVDVVAVLLATTIILDALVARTEDYKGPREEYGGVMTLVLAVVLLGPAPAALIGLVTNLVYAGIRRTPVHYAIGNAFAYALVPLAAGVASERWIGSLHGFEFALAAALLTIAFDASAAVVIYFQAWVHGDLVLRQHLGAYFRVLPWLGAASIIVAGAADGYRAGGFAVLVMFMLALIACEVLLLRLGAVEVRLRAERDRSATYLQMVGTMVVSLDDEGRVAFLNERARELLGDVVSSAWLDVDTGPRILSWTPTPLPDGTVLLSGEDVTERQEAEERMARLAFLDTLTGLENRTVLDRALPVALAVADEGGTAAAFLLIDIDGFKRVNDEHGHATGDRVLAEAAARLRAVAQADELLVRRRGDEFVLLVPSLGADDECGARRAAAAIAERVARAFEAPFSVAGGVDVSVATALHPFDGPDLEQAANRALHGLKQRSLSGR